MTAIALDAPDRQKAILPPVRKVISGIAWSLITLLVVATAALGIYTHTGHGHLTPVLTGSMRPGIQPGDVVVTHRVPVTSLHVGDIVVFMPPGANIAKVHRIHTLQKAGNSIVVTNKGDANNATDPWGKIIMKGNAYKVAFTIPKVGWLVNGGLRWIILGFVLVGAAFITRWTWQYVRS
jgi:signal peptidase I